MKRGWTWAIFGALLLALPLAAVVRARVNRPPLPRFGTVPAFVLDDQLGRPFDSRALGGRVWVADFIFTSCSMVCPRLTEEMAKLQRHLVNRGLDGRVSLISITVDPERDTPERLAAYAAGFQANPSVWKFLTGSSKQIEDAVVHGFKQAVEKEKDPASHDGFTILHGSSFVLVDEQGVIRGFYDSTDPADLSKLNAHLTQLLQ